MLARQARRETKKLTAAFVATNPTDSVACVATAAVRAAFQDGLMDLNSCRVRMMRAEGQTWDGLRNDRSTRRVGR
jgi:hypothetical protein